MDQNENPNKNKTINGIVDKVVFHDQMSGKSILSVVKEDGKYCRLIGHINNIKKGDSITSSGVWKKEEKFGWQFIAEIIQVVSNAEEDRVVDENSMEAFDFSNVLNRHLKEFRNVYMGYENDEDEEEDEDYDEECEEYIKKFKELGADYIEKRKPKAEKATEPKKSATQSIDGALYNSDMTKLISAPKDVASFVIPDTITCIGGGAFAKSQIESIDIPNSVTTIGNGAFSDCCGLKDVVIPSSVEHIGDMVFTGCENLVSIHVEEGNITFRDIEGVLYSYNLSQLLYVPNGISSITIFEQTTIIKYGAFHGCRKLTNLIIPSTTEDISQGEFKSCSSLSSVTISNMIANEGVDNYFYAKELREITLSNSVTQIHRNTFGRCSCVQSIQIPSSVQVIDEHAFDDCSSLKSIIVDEGNTYFKGTGGVLYNSDLSEILYVPKRITSTEILPTVSRIGKDAFLGHVFLRNVVISNSVKNIEDSAFSGCTSLEKIIIPNSVETIGDCTFEGCSKLKNIDLPSSVVRIGKMAFSHCKDLETIVLPEKLEKVEDATFRECTGLKDIVIPYGVTTIERNAFFACYSLESITIPDTLKSISENAFSGCRSLNCVKISNIENWCNIDFQSDWFDNNYANPLYYAHSLELNGDLIKELEIPEGITEIKQNAFINCKSLEKIMLPSSVTKIGKRAFYGCSNLVVDVPDTVTHIGEDAFYGCKSYIMDKTIDVEWKDVRFNTGYIRVPGLFGSWIDVKDENIDETVGSMRKHLKKMMPHLTVHFGNNGEATIVNAVNLHEMVIALQIKNDLAKLIREGQSTVEILKKIDQLSKKHQHIFIPRDKTPYINFLLGKHAADKYPLVPIVEYIGGSREEGALYTIIIDNQPNIVWENNKDSRASYVFRCTEDDYIETRQQVFDFIMAEAPKKRKYLNSKECTNIFKEKPRMVVHNTLASWAQRLMCNPELVVESTSVTQNTLEQDIIESTSNPAYRTIVSIEDVEGELGDMSYQEYDVSVNAYVKADYYKIYNGEKQLLLSSTFTVYETVSGDFGGNMSEWDIEDFCEEGDVDRIVRHMDINDFTGLSNLDFFALGIPTSGEGLSADEIGNLLSKALNDAGIDWSCGEFKCTKLFSEDEPSGDFDN